MDIAEFVKERDEVLLSGDLDRLYAFHAKYNPDVPAFASREIAEASMHKARTAAKSLPIEARLESKRWLTNHGMKSLDDGDLPPDATEKGAE